MAINSIIRLIQNHHVYNAKNLNMDNSKHFEALRGEQTERQVERQASRSHWNAL